MNIPGVPLMPCYCWSCVQHLPEAAREAIRKNRLNQQAKANQILRDHLTSQQLSDWDNSGSFKVKGSDNQFYRLDEDVIWCPEHVIDNYGDRRYLTVFIREPDIPFQTQVLARKLWVETDVEHLYMKSCT